MTELEIDDSEDAASKASRAPAVLRAAAVLRHLAAAGRRPVPLRDLASALSAPKSSIANICAALEYAGLVRRFSDNAGYTLDRGILELAGAYLSGIDVVELFYDTVRRLREASMETVQLAAFEGTDVIYLARNEGEQPIRLTSDIGRRLPATHTATGKAILAGMDDAAVRVVLRSHNFPRPTNHSIGNIDDLCANLRRIREAGYAVDDEETAEGVVCYGVAIPAGPNVERLALSVTLLKVRDNPTVRDQLVGELRVLATVLAARHSPPSGRESTPPAARRSLD